MPAQASFTLYEPCWMPVLFTGSSWIYKGAALWPLHWDKSLEAAKFPDPLISLCTRRGKSHATRFLMHLSDPKKDYRKNTA